MAQLVASSSAGQPEDVEALFDLDPDMYDDNPSNRVGNNTRAPLRESAAAARRDEGLGLDEEVIITKKRQPVAKLDATRLLSDPGISKLQRISKTRLKFRGKGHEFSDVAQLLRTYQLWLDDLYPRAKLTDGLAIIEKLGHSKRIQVMRKAWIDESKPKALVDEDEAELESRGTLHQTVNPGSEPARAHLTHANGSQVDMGNSSEPDLFSAPRTNGMRPSASSSLDEIEGGPDEDELDALLAEEPMQYISEKGNSLDKALSPCLRQPPELSYEDDEEAMREMDEFW